MKKLSSLIFLTLLINVLHAETIFFSINLFGDSVGNSIVTKNRDAAGVDNYVLDSRVKAKIMWITRENHTHYEAKYKSGKLISAIYYEINNGKKDKWSNITFDGTTYQVDSYKGKKTFTEAPTHSIGTMYCDGYSNVKKRFFYEPEADFNTLQYPDANTIEFKSSDGNRNIYHFKSGQISTAEFHTTFATIYLKRLK